MVATRTTKSQPFPPCDEPAANALRHGMTATRFVPPEQNARRLAIRSRLIAIYRPESREEIHCVDELALAEAQLYDIEAAAWKRFDWERAHARERFDRRMRDQLDKDLAAWHANPFLWRDILAMTWLGASHLARVWAEIADTLANSESACPLERIFDAVASQESPFDVDNICFQGIWIIQRHLATTPDPQAEIERWFELTCDKNHKPRPDQRSRARWFLDHAPDPATARRELLAKAMSECDRWTLQANDLRSRYETDREHAADRAVGFVPSDEKSTRESRLTLRYLIAARNRVEKLERRLEALKKLRSVRNIRQNRSFGEMPSHVDDTMTESLTARILAEIDETEAAIDALDMKIAETEARNAPIDASPATKEPGKAAPQAVKQAPAKARPRQDSTANASVSPDHPLPEDPLASIPSGTSDTGRRPRRPDPQSICNQLRRKEKARRKGR